VTRTGNGNTTVYATGSSVIALTFNGDGDITYPADYRAHAAREDNKTQASDSSTDTTNLVANGRMGNVASSSAFTSGADSFVDGFVTARTAVTLGANSRVTGNVTVGTAFTSGANSVVEGNVVAHGAITLGAQSRILGSVHSDIGVITWGDGATAKSSF